MLGCLKWCCYSQPDRNRLKRRYTGVTVVLTGLCVLVLFPLKAQRTEEKRAHTCEHCSEGGAWVRIVFNRWESWGGGGEMREGVCMCVEGGFWSMFFLCLSTSKLPLDLSSQDDRTHPCVCTFTLSLSYLSISSSLQSLSIPLPDKLSRCLFVFSLVTESIVTSLCFCIHLYRVQGW